MFWGSEVRAVSHGHPKPGNFPASIQQTSITNESVNNRSYRHSLDILVTRGLLSAIKYEWNHPQYKDAKRLTHTRTRTENIRKEQA